MIVVFEGFGLDVPGPVCPGTAAFGDGSFDYWTVSPTSGGACDGEPDGQEVAPVDPDLLAC